MIGIASAIASSISKGIPGVPLQALDAIQDENARLVLRSIIDGWHVRNGTSGNGDNRFVTAQELTQLSGAVGGLENTVRSITGAGRPVTQGDLSRALNDLHSLVFESTLYKSLAERVDLIDKPGGIFDRLGAAETTLVNEVLARVDGDKGLAKDIETLGLRLGDAETVYSREINLLIESDTVINNAITVLGGRVGDAETGLIEEVKQRVNADNALQTSIETQFSSVNDTLSLIQRTATTNANNVSALAETLDQLQVTVGGNSVALAEESRVRADADGKLFGQYTLRIDVNGRVSGFGLAADENSSDFIVRTDRFSIVSPNGNVAAVIMTNNRIVVYDEGGVARVVLGNLA